MFEDCQCAKRRITAIRRAFEGRQSALISNLGLIKQYFEAQGKSKGEVAALMEQAGVPSKSFLGSHTMSMLFDNERDILESTTDKAQRDDDFFKNATGGSIVENTDKNQLTIVTEGLSRPPMRNTLLFCDIRGTYQRLGKQLADKASEWLEEAQVGQAHMLEKRLTDFQTNFQDQFKEISDRVKEKVKNLHRREGIYHGT